MIIPFQYNRPVFVAIPKLKVNNKVYGFGDELKWRELELEEDLVLRLYTQHQIGHSDDLEKNAVVRVGDGLDELDHESLQQIVLQINSKPKVKEAGHKCRTSKILDKQRGFIRSFRRNYAHLLTED